MLTGGGAAGGASALPPGEGRSIASAGAEPRRDCSTGHAGGAEWRLYLGTTRLTCVLPGTPVWFGELLSGAGDILRLDRSRRRGPLDSAVVAPVGLKNARAAMVPPSPAPGGDLWTSPSLPASCSKIPHGAPMGVGRRSCSGRSSPRHAPRAGRGRSRCGLTNATRERSRPPARSRTTVEPRSATACSPARRPTAEGLPVPSACGRLSYWTRRFTALVPWPQRTSNPRCPPIGTTAPRATPDLRPTPNPRPRAARTRSPQHPGPRRRRPAKSRLGARMRGHSRSVRGDS